jgi:hypothetical protein
MVGCGKAELLEIGGPGGHLEKPLLATSGVTQSCIDYSSRSEHSMRLKKRKSTQVPISTGLTG